MKRLIVCLLLTFELISCAAPGNNIDDLPVKFDEAYMNRQIKLVAIKELNPFKTEYSVGLHLEYNSENKIVFPPNYNLRIFIKENGKWLEIKEKPTVRSENEVILSPNIPTSYAQIVSFFPKLPDITKRYNMRVYVFGDMETEAGIIKVASFVDFVLLP